MITWIKHDRAKRIGLCWWQDNNSWKVVFKGFVVAVVVVDVPVDVVTVAVDVVAQLLLVVVVVVVVVLEASELTALKLTKLIIQYL